MDNQEFGCEQEARPSAGLPSLGCCFSGCASLNVMSCPVSPEIRSTKATGHLSPWQGQCIG